MNGELAQLICLATNGSKWLRDPSQSNQLLAESNSTFQYVATLQFVHGGHQQSAPPSSPREAVATWLDGLLRSGVKRLWLVIPETPRVSLGGHDVDEHSLVAFANAGPWSLLAEATPRGRIRISRARPSELWHGTWTVGDRNAPNHRIWLVNYTSAEAPNVTATSPDVAQAEEELISAVTHARNLSVEQDLDNWTDWFNKALAEAPEMPYHPEMVPRDWPTDATRCAARAAQAWVFGGMGSWNDLYVQDEQTQERFEQVSRRLYRAVLNALVAATNCPL